MSSMLYLDGEERPRGPFSVKGQYVAFRDGATYSYDAVWSMDEHRVVWAAVVSREDRLRVGRPNGAIDLTILEKTNTESWVRAAVELTIEKNFG